MPTLTIPDAAYRRLAERAVAQNTTVDDLAARLLAEDPADSSVSLDTGYHADCAAETSAVPTLAEVRAMTAKFPGSLAADLIAERDDR